VATVLRRRFVQGFRAAFALAGVLLCASRPALASDAPRSYPLLGRPAPELLQHLVSGAGTTFRLSEHRGEVVLLGFWTSWCGICGDYLGQLRRLDETYARAGLVVAGVSLDDEAARAVSALRAAGVKFANGVDATKVYGERFAVDDVPLTLLIDRDGIVRYVHGALDGPADAAVLKEIRQLLDE
jgi:peroxiredoxin